MGNEKNIRKIIEDFCNAYRENNKIKKVIISNRQDNISGL